MKQYGIEYKDLTTELKKKIVSMYFEGKSKDEIITISGASRRAVPQVIKEAGLNFRRKNRYTLNENYFSKIDTEIKAYLLGIICADGCITTTNYFAIGMIDIEPLELLKKELKYTGDIYIPKRKENKNWNTAYRINFSSKEFCNNLRSLGVVENKCLVFDNLPNIRKDLIPHYLRGYFDGDGCISTYIHADGYERALCYFICTEQMAKNIKAIIDPIMNYDSKIDDSITQEMKYLRIHDKKAMEKLFNYLYKDSDCYIIRKYEKWQYLLGSLEDKSSKENGVNLRK